MTRRVSAFYLMLALGAAAPSSATQSGPPACANAGDCREQAEAAITMGDAERAHDLAWRAVQRGPRNDAPLMYLLARTQALSGRPDDALVMLRRLAEMGVAADASAGEFRLTRDLPGWPAVESLIAGAALVPVAPLAPLAPLAPKAPLAPLAPKAPLAPEAPLAPLAPSLVDSAGRFSSREFAPGGLACDAVSRRYVFGDRPGRKLIIVAEGAGESVDLTRAVSAGFRDVMALDIDTTNGNLWVASAEPDGRTATLHKLQLISGRALASYDVPDGLGPVRPVDLTVTASGTVLILDAAGGRVLALRPGATAIEVLATLKDEAPVSLVASSRNDAAYVAHRDGLSSIDLRTRTVSPLTGSKGTALEGIERLRRHATGLVGVQARPDGSRRLVRVALNAAGRSVTRLHVIDVPLPAGAAPIFAAVCGNTLAFLVGESDGSADQPSTAWTVRRTQLTR